MLIADEIGVTTKAAITKHDPAICRMAFGKYPSTGCARCAELAAGSPARAGWQAGYYRMKRAQAEQDAQLVREIRAHDCRQAHCGPVCTFGQW